MYTSEDEAFRHNDTLEGLASDFDTRLAYNRSKIGFVLKQA